ncbi:MAG: beta-ketoacyl synthase [Planctomycetes bacterium]|nr:beta-ketoacyl synthase [Planctomycetota bacterium]
MPNQQTPIAITAMGAITPLGEGVRGLWEGLMRGDCAIKPHRGSPYPVAVLTPPDAPPTSLPALGRNLLRKGSKPVFETKVAGSRRALVLASTKGDNLPWVETRLANHIRGRRHRVAPRSDTVDMAAAARGYADLAGVGGRAFAVSAACASGSQAVIEAAEMLVDGDADEVVVVGVDVLSDFVLYGFGALQALSKQPARPFDASRDGLSLGEAAAAVVLRRATDTDMPLALITGWGSSNDANHISGPSRDGYGLSLAIDRALKGLDRGSVRAICAHGTATRYNDAMEAHAFHRSFGAKVPPVFGVKGSIGHTLGAAALIELIVSAQCAREHLLPPTVGFTRQDHDEPALDVVASPREIKPGAILSTNSGFGGINTALVIEGAP